MRVRDGSGGAAGPGGNTGALPKGWKMLTDPTSGRFRKATSQGGADAGGLCRLASLAKRGELPGTTSGAGMTLGGRDMRNIDQKHAMIHMARQVRGLSPTPSP